MVKTIVGLMGSSVASGSSKMATVASVQTYLDVCKKYSVKELDTARVYNGGKSEELLGQTSNSAEGFLIETKAPAFGAGTLTYDKILSNANASLKALNRKSIDLYYFHGPDRETALEESCRAIGQLYSEGKISAFGVSNLRADEVEQIIDICTKNQYPLPSVYQGGYNPFARSAEKGLFPLLRKHKIAFYAYSPLAGGFFSRPTDQLRQPPTGSRMDQMPVFGNIYVNETSLAWHEKASDLCAREGDGEGGMMTLKEALFRWFMHHSPLEKDDGVILGASSSEQLEENLVACGKGPLSEKMVSLFEELWTTLQEAGKTFPYHV